MLLTDDSDNVLETAFRCLLTDELRFIPTYKLRPSFHSRLWRRWQMYTYHYGLQYFDGFPVIDSLLGTWSVLRYTEFGRLLR